MQARPLALLAAGLVAVVATGLLLVRMERLPPALGGQPWPTPSASLVVAEPPTPPAMDVQDVYARFVDPDTTGDRAFGDPVRLTVAPVGTLDLPSGRLVAADASLFDGVPFSTILPPGTYEVSVLRADIGPGSDERVAAALLRVGDGEPDRWVAGLLPGQDPTELGPDEWFGYPVDSGTAAFASAEAAERVNADPASVERYGETLLAAMSPSDTEWLDAVAIDVDDRAGTDVVAIAAGWGDGVYPTWFGLGADGAPLVVLTEFGVLDAP